MSLQPLSILIFDMDGLMLDTESIYRDAWVQTAAEFGFDMGDDLYLQFVGRHIEDCKAILHSAYGDAFPLAAYLDGTLKACRRLIDEHGVAPRPGLLELLDYAAQTGLRTAVATSSSRSHVQRCMRELVNRFEIIVTGDDVARRKPAPDIYHVAAQRLNAAPADCLVLEDSDAGVEAAAGAGMRVIMVPDLKPPSPQSRERALHIAPSLHAVRTMLVAEFSPAG